jgi:probable F420-dependent oxidoreductase
LNPFRFGLSPVLTSENWVERLREIEELGFSSVFFSDHFGPQWDPVAAIAAAAAVTERLIVGSLVYVLDFRHPMVYAKTAATHHVLSGGRHEFGVGAGWLKKDFQKAGLRFDSANKRIDRLEEGLMIIKSLWTNEKTDFHGKYFDISDAERTVDLPEGERPKILIGGGGRKILSMAGRQADIVSIIPRMSKSSFTNEERARTFKELEPGRILEKIGWIRRSAEKAGRNPDEIELGMTTFETSVTENSERKNREIAERWGMSLEEVEKSPKFLIGTPSEIIDKLKQIREETGISYIVLRERGGDIFEFSEVMKPLIKL